MGALSTGIAAGKSLSTGNAIGDVIKGILETARAKGLLNVQAQGNIALAQAKGLVGQSKPIVQVDKSGIAKPVLNEFGDPAIVSKSTRVITPREGRTESDIEFDKMFAQRVRNMAAKQGNVIEESAAGTATPVSNIVTQGAGQTQLSDEEIINQWLDRLEDQ